MMTKQKKRKKIRNQPPPLLLENEAYYYTQLRAALRNESIHGASEALKKVRKCNPQAELKEEQLRLHLMRSTARIKAKDFPSALQDLEKVQLLEPEDIRFFQGMARYFLDSDQLQQGLEWFQIRFYQDQLPKDAAIYCLKFLILLKQWPQLETLVQNQKSQFWAADLHWVRGILHLRAGEQAEAIESFAKTKKSGQWMHQAPAWNAWIKLRQHHPRTFSAINGLPESEIKKHLGSKACLIFPDSHWNYRFILPNTKENTYYKLLDELETKEWSRAADILPKLEKNKYILSLDPQIVGRIYRLAGWQAWSEYQNINKAVFFWRKALAKSPDDLPFRISLAILLGENPLHFELAIFHETEVLLRKKAKQQPATFSVAQLQYNLAELKALEAGVQYCNDKPRKAKQCCIAAEKVAPESPYVLASLVSLYHGEREPKKIMPYLERLFEQNKKDPSIYCDLKDIYQQLNEASKLSRLRSQYGEFFGDHVHSEHELNILFGYTLQAKDPGLLQFLLEKKIRPSAPNHFILELGNCFYELFSNLDGSDDHKKERNIKKFVLPGMIECLLKEHRENLPLQAKLMELVTCGLVKVKLTGIANLLSSFEKRLMLQTNNFEAHHSYVIIQILQNVSNKQLAS
ncbi:MAG: hypothetical protein COB67_11790, partial [SAR324 cluster bacterium]